MTGTSGIYEKSPDSKENTNNLSKDVKNTKTPTKANRAEYNSLDNFIVFSDHNGVPSGERRSYTEKQIPNSSFVLRVRQ